MTTKTCRRRPKPGATYTGHWLTEDPRDCFAAGFCCMLAITPVGDEADDVSDEDIYSVECRIEDGRVKGWTVQRLTQDGEVEAYTLPGNLSRCQCRWSQYQPNGKPCRHRSALFAALTELGFELPPLK